MPLRSRTILVWRGSTRQPSTASRFGKRQLAQWTVGQCYPRANHGLDANDHALAMAACDDPPMLRAEWSRLFTVTERHRWLLARLVLAFLLSLLVFAVGTILIWVSERGHKGGDINGLGDAAFSPPSNYSPCPPRSRTHSPPPARSSISALKCGPSSSSPPSPAASPPSLAPATLELPLATSVPAHPPSTVTRWRGMPF